MHLETIQAPNLCCVPLQTDDSPNLLAKEELNLLARLMGSMKAQNTARDESGFRINLFPSDQEEEDEA